MINYSNLTSISLPTNLVGIAEGAFHSCTGLTTITIPESCTTLGWSAFYNCSHLQTITLPEKLTFIDDDVFKNCTSLNDIYVSNPIPVEFASNFTVFEGINKTTCQLHVPAQAINAYQNAEKWKDFLNIVALTTEISPTTVDEFKIFPNPATDYICLNTTKDINRIQIIDRIGKTLLFIGNQTNKVIDIRSLTKGIYFMKIQVENGIETMKFYKK